MFKRANFKGAWGLKGPVVALVFYSCILFPAVHILFPQTQKWASVIYPAYFGLVIFFLLFVGRVTWSQLGFHKELWKNNLSLGGLTGLLVIALVPLLDFFIEVSGLDQTELFAGAELRQPEADSSLTLFIISTIFITVAEQGFLTGYVFQAMVRKIKPILAIYLAGLIFALAHFDFQLGSFLIGFITATFYSLNGSLVAPLVFQTACHCAGWLLTHHYPKVFTLLGFLF